MNKLLFKWEWTMQTNPGTIIELLLIQLITGF